MRRMWSSSFLRGLLVLLLVPCAVLLSLAGYVWLVNTFATAGMVKPAISPQVVWPLQDAAYLITIDPSAEVTEHETLPPLDIAFLVDVSGSMLPSLPAMSEAVRVMTGELNRGRGDEVRFSLMRFDTEAEVLTGWTSNPKEFSEGLRQLEPITGDNNSRQAFLRLDELLDEARDDATRAVVFYTDGAIATCSPQNCPGGPMSESEIVEAAVGLRERGVDLYSVGVPGGGSHPLMLEVTGDSSRVFDPADVQDLAYSFRSLAEAVMGAAGSRARIGNRLDGRHFATPIEGTEWTRTAGGTLLLDIGPLPATATTYMHPLRPRSAGLWRVGVEPPTITWVDESEGGLVRGTATHRPAMLVITWFTLLLAGLPALLWGLVHLPQRRDVPLEEAPALPPPARRFLPPARLPSLPPVPEPRGSVVPTLFLGLGGAGRRALHAVRAQLKQSHPDAGGELPYRFLWLDVDATESDRETAFDAWNEYPIDSLVAPPEVVRTGDDLPAPGHIPPHLQWFDAACYHDAAREDLNLASGSRGDRMLARLALVRWLEQGELLPELIRNASELVQQPSADGVSQVVVFAAWEGGVGGGWFLDAGRMLQRIGRHLQQQGVTQYVPEIIGVPCVDESRAEIDNRRALELELESAMMIGGLPLHTCYVPEDQLLDRTDSESPYHWIASLSAPDELQVAVQCGEIAALLVARQAREALFAVCGELSAKGLGGRRAVVSVGARSVRVLPRQVQEQVQSELLLRMLGPDVLLDIVADEGGGFGPKNPTQEEAERLLVDWSAAEPPRSPIQQLLSSALDPTVAGSVQGVRTAEAEQLGAAFVTALNRQLHGARHGSGWLRGLTPAAAVVVLRLLAQRLRDSLAGNAGAGRVADLATAAAQGLQVWLDALCAECEGVTRRQAQRTASHEILHELRRHATLGLESSEGTAAWSRQVLERWLGTIDTVSPLRERIVFAAVPHGDSLRIEVRTFIDEPRIFTEAAPFVRELSELTARLARGLRIARVGGALSALTSEEREGLARDLVDRSSRPEQVLVVAPSTRGLPVREVAAVEAFCAELPEPPGNGPREDLRCDDSSAIWRVEMQRQLPLDTGAAPFVTIAEQEAERLRQCMRRRYQVEIPVLPPQLRIALAHPRELRSFVRAYRHGHIVSRNDAEGIAQWYVRESDLQLTFGEGAGLAAAAAGYVFRVSDAPQQVDEDGSGDFALLHRWLAESGVPSDDVLVLAAIETMESYQSGGGKS